MPFSMADCRGNPPNQKTEENTTKPNCGYLARLRMAHLQVQLQTTLTTKERVLITLKRVILSQ